MTTPNAPEPGPGAFAGHVHAVRALGPERIIAGLVALAATWLSEHYHAPVMLFALLPCSACGASGGSSADRR